MTFTEIVVTRGDSRFVIKAETLADALRLIETAWPMLDPEQMQRRHDATMAEFDVLCQQD
jgi:hypothetical protein